MDQKFDSMASLEPFTHDLVLIGAGPEICRPLERLLNTENPLPRIGWITQGWEAEQSNNPAWEDLWQRGLARGIDGIRDLGQGTLTSTGPIWETAQRRLVAPAYVLTSPYYPDHPLSPAPIPQTWHMDGHQPHHFALAQTLVQRGDRLFFNASGLLPAEDRAMVNLLQCYLEALGVIFTDNPPSDAIYLDLSPPFLPWHWFNQFPVNTLQANPHQLKVNDRLHNPTYPSLYACGQWLGGYDLPSIAEQEVQWILNHLINPNSAEPLDYGRMPWGIATDPPWFRVGYSAAQAEQRGLPWRIYQAFEPFNPHSLLRGTVKLTTTPDGRLLGAYWFGALAPAGITLLTWAITAGLSLSQLYTLPIADPLLAQTLHSLTPNPRI